MVNICQCFMKKIEYFMEYKIEEYNKSYTYREGEEVIKSVRYDVSIASNNIEYIKYKVEA